MYPADEQALDNAVEYAFGSGVSGDVVEFGCLTGRTSVILAKAMAKMESSYGRASDQMHGIPNRKLWLFDSFEGFPETSTDVDAESPHIKARVWHAGEPKGGSPTQIISNCSKYFDTSRLVIMSGWFCNMLVHIPDETKFSVVHIDCDYYSSTFEVLSHLFNNDMFSDGCTILFDDWYCNKGSPRFGEQRAWKEVWKEIETGGKLSFSDWGPYGMAGRRFIVHVEE